MDYTELSLGWDSASVSGCNAVRRCGYEYSEHTQAPTARSKKADGAQTRRYCSQDLLYADADYKSDEAAAPASLL